MLGLFIEGVLGEFDSSPPIHPGNPVLDIPPAIGYPITVDHAGKIALPFIEPVLVRGKTIEEVRVALELAYRDEPEKSPNRVKSGFGMEPQDPKDEKPEPKRYLSSRHPSNLRLDAPPILRPSSRIMVSLIRPGKRNGVPRQLGKPKSEEAKPKLNESADQKEIEQE